MKTFITKIINDNEQVIRWAIVFCSTVFFLCTIKQGHNWGGDFALYIAHAKNIATGHSYHDTGYIYNPFSHWYGPMTYPPIFPLLLSIVYKIFGLDLDMMRVMIVICFSIMLWAFDVYSDFRIVNKKLLIPILIMVAFSPYYWETKNSVISDIPYTMFLFLSLIVSDKIDRTKIINRKIFCYAILFGLLSYLAYGTRSVGVFLIISYCINQIIRRRTTIYILFTPLVIFLILFLIQNVFLHSDSSYMDSFSTSDEEEMKSGMDVYIGKIIKLISSLFQNTNTNILNYAKVIKWYWQAGTTSVISIIVTIATGVLSIIGIISVLKKNTNTGEIYFLVYTTILVISPFFQGFRYLIPIFPMYALYTFKVFDSSPKEFVGYGKRNIPLIMTFALVLVYISAYSKIEFGPYTYGLGKKETQEMFSYIKNNTPKDSVIIFQKPRLMALFGERKSTTYFYKEGGDFDAIGFFDHLINIKATHLVVSSGVWGDEEISNYVQWMRKQNEHKILVYKNKDFEIYRIEYTKIL